MNIYLCRNGETNGPFTREQILAQLRCGMITIKDRALYEGKNKSLEEILASELDVEPETAIQPTTSVAKWIALLTVLIAVCSAYYLGLSRAPHHSVPESKPSDPIVETASPTTLPKKTGTLAVASHKQPATISTPGASIPNTPEIENPAIASSPAIITDIETKKDLPNTVIINGTNQLAVTPATGLVSGSNGTPASEPAKSEPTEAEVYYTKARNLDLNINATKDDVDQAIACYRKSVNLGNTLAMVALADLMRKSDYDQYKIEIEQLYLQAAAGGNPKAILFNLSKAKTVKDFSTSLLTAEAFGSDKACLMLKSLYSSQYKSRFPDFQPSPVSALQWQLIYDYLNGFTSNSQTQQMKRTTSAMDVQSATQLADTFIEFNHLKHGESFEKTSLKIAFFRKVVTDDKSESSHPQESPVLSLPSTQSSGQSIALPSNWSSTLSASSGGSSATIADLSRLLSMYGKPDTALEWSSPLYVYAGIPYLTPLNEVVKQLKLSSPKSKSKISCAGMPDGLSYYSFDGKFEGDYNRLYLVVDQKDQLVSVELVDESPKGGAEGGDRDLKNRTYNFVDSRCKGLDFMHVDYEVQRSQEYESNSLIIDLSLTDPRLRKTLKSAKWYVPQPLVNLILFCVNNAQKR